MTHNPARYSLAMSLALIVIGQVTLMGQALNPSSMTIGSDGGVVAATLTSTAAWSAASNDAFLRVAGPLNGIGSATILVSADANAAATSRIGTLNVGGLELTISQLPKYVQGKGSASLFATPSGDMTTVGVSRTGKVYFGESSTASVKSWDPATRQITTYYSPGSSLLGLPPVAGGITEDAAGNIYFTDVNNNRLLRNGTVLATGGMMNKPQGVAVSGNIVYIANTGGNNVLAYSLSTQVWSTVGSGFSQPTAVAVFPGSSAVYVSDVGSQTIKRILNGVTSIVARSGPGTTGPSGFPAIVRQAMAADAEGNVYFVVGSTSQTLHKWEAATGADISLGSVSGARAASVDSNNDLYLASSAGIQRVNTGTPNASLGNTFLMAGSAGGPQSVGVDFLPGHFSAPWSASSSNSWLQITNPAGTGPATLLFTASPNLTALPRTGRILLDSGLVLTVTQAGTNYTPVSAVTTLAPSVSGYGAATDTSGNVFLASAGANSIQQWNSVSQLVSTVQSGLNFPSGVAVDSLGTIFIADTNSNTLKRRTSSGLSTVVGSGLSAPSGVTVDAIGNLFIADTNNNALKMWTASTNATSTLASGLSLPSGVAADGSGNVYIADRLSHSIKYWNAATRQLSTVIATGLSSPYGVAVDGYRNLYISDGAAALKIWNAASQQLTAAATGQGGYGAAVDALGNAYATAGGSSLIKLTRAYIAAAGIDVPQSAGSDVLPVVLPSATPLNGVLSPTSDQPWLTIGSVVNGRVAFSFLANTTGVQRTANIRVLGQNTLVTQAGLILTPSAGSTPQSATANMLFAAPLGVTLRDGAGLPVSGVSITFTAPTSGATGTFPGGVSSVAVATNASGFASVPITANPVPGTFVVTARAGNAKTINYVLSNTTGTAASILPNPGATPQAADISTAFANRLSVTVRDAGGSPLGGVNVTFAAPSTGASGTFQNGLLTLSGTTNSSGVWEAQFTANATPGTYTVTATVAGLPSASFSLTNKAVATLISVRTGSTPQSAPVNAAFATALDVTLQDAARNLIGGANVTFTAPAGAGLFSNGQSSITVASNSSGVAAAAFVAGSTPRTEYVVTASTGSLIANFYLRNYGPAVSMTANPGSTPQSVKTGIPFAPLAVTAKDSVGNGVPGLSVLFTAPAASPTGTFGGLQSVSVVTNLSGVSSAPVFSGTGAGSFTVNATSPGLPGVSFALTNGTPTSMVATSPTSVTVGILSTTAPSVQVRDQFGNGLTGVSVTFSTSSPSAGTFPNGSSTITVTSGVGGTARTTLTTTKVTGNYTVNAASAGLTSVRFTIAVR